ncbi:MAG: helix-turn-helix domain-containing protein [Deltaproteobacteria bacterium]|nr:helix-turn-helix domain-containing protein [Deltaproteobacteria bacterium]
MSNGQRVPIQQQAWKLLTILVREPGRVFPRESLYERLWPAGTFVDFEHGLNTVVRKLRRALGDSPAHPSFIETVPRRGYRFVGSAVVTDAPGCGSGQDSDV